MQFVYPQILWALAVLAIPVIIHLFHFRRFKKVYFTNVRLLKEIKEEKSARNKVRNLLVLIARLLAFTFLVLAFAQPFIDTKGEVQQGVNYVSIFVDNSNSMLASSEDVPLLDKARQKAEEIVLAYNNTDQFQILSHEMTGVQQRWLDRDNALTALAEIQVTPEVNSMSYIYNRQKEGLPGRGNPIFYYISDFQRSITDAEFENDSLVEINLLPLQSVQENNLAIDSVWFESVVPSLNQSNQLLARITNLGNEDREDVRVSLVQNGQTRPEGTVDIKANSTVVDTVNLLFTNTGWQKLQVRIEDYPIQFDDTYNISFNIKETLNVLSIHNGIADPYLTALFAGLDQFELEHTSYATIQYDKLVEKDLVILDGLYNFSTGLMGALRNFIENGGNVLLFPAAEADIDNYNNLLRQLGANTITGWSTDQRRVYRINTSEFVFADVFEETGTNLKLPVTSGNYIFTNFSARGGEYLLKYRDGNDYISKYELGQGNFFISASPLDRTYNDLVNNAEIFVPLLYKSAYSSNSRDRLALTIGVDNYAEVKNTGASDEIIYRISGPEEFIPGQTNRGTTTMLNFNNMISRAGHYDVGLNDRLATVLAFNYDRTESDLSYWTPEALTSRYGDRVNVIDTVLQANLAGIIKEKDKGIVLWRWCLILVLVFLAIETLLLRFWKA